jgi:SAM-dependent methyltransferase
MNALLGLILRSANHTIASIVAQQLCFFPIPCSWEGDQSRWRSQRPRVKNAAVPQLTPVAGKIDTGRPLHDADRVKSTYSTLSHNSYSTTTTSSARTGFSNQSIFSQPSRRHDDLLSEDSIYGDDHSPVSKTPSPVTTPPTFVDNRRPPPPRQTVDSTYAGNIQMEPVESRTGSRMSDGPSKAAQGPFARALGKMESAGARIVSARLSEEWEGLDDDDESLQEVIFEKRLWALTAYQRLTQNKQLQSPAHDLLASSRPAEQRRVLHLHGNLADGWVLATRYPAATVYTLSSANTTNLPTSHPAPLNHHSLFSPSISSAMPFPDNYFDVVVSRFVSTSLRNDEWARSFFDCMRVLKPGGSIEILSVDAHMNGEGPQLQSWVDEHITCRLEAHNISMVPSESVLDTMEIVGLENIRRARVALPAYLGSPKAVARAAPSSNGASTPSPQDVVDASRMMAYLGRHFYQDLYGKFVRLSQGEEWFWNRKDVRDECEKYQTKMVLTIACAQKPGAAANHESYLNI